MAKTKDTQPAVSAKLTGIKNSSAADLLRTAADDMKELAGSAKFNGVSAEVSDEVTALVDQFLQLKERIEAS